MLYILVAWHHFLLMMAPYTCSIFSTLVLKLQQNITKANNYWPGH